MFIQKNLVVSQVFSAILYVLHPLSQASASLQRKARFLVNKLRQKYMYWGQNEVKYILFGGAYFNECEIRMRTGNLSPLFLLYVDIG